MTIFSDLIMRLATKFLQKILDVEPPVSPPSKSPFPIVESLPGQEFIANKNLVSKAIAINDDGSFTFSPGDFAIPVMAYCMHCSGISPLAHRYRIVLLKGSKAHIIRIINNRAIEKYAPHDIQTLLWAIQSGIPYDLMATHSKAIIDEFAPEFKNELSEDLLLKIENKWNSIAKILPGVPNFSEVSEQILFQLGDVGAQIKHLVQLREEIRRRGASYETFASFVERAGLSGDLGTSTTTQWSQLEPSVYARFLTREGHSSPAIVELRVEGTTSARVDFSSFLADPQSTTIQTLAISPLLGLGSTIALPFAPEILTALLLIGVALGAWNIVIRILENTNSTDPQLKDAIRQAENALSEAHDKLLKPAKDAGILDGVEQDNEGGFAGSRVYIKPGGKVALEKDFEKILGVEAPPQGEIRIKNLPDGSTVVARPKSSGPGEWPTLEIQSPRKGPQDTQLKIKIRYN